MHALTDDECVRREISEAHEASWQAAVRYLEREACVVRRGKGGRRREQGRGFVAAAFRHRTSRAQDPHLHTHVVVANMSQAKDGTWLALDGRAILQTYRLAAGYLYEAQLRYELTQRLGLAWREPVKGMAELERVPEEATRAFSTRRQALVEHMDAMGTEGFAASRVAALATRERKEQVDLPRLREEWKARAAEHGLGRRELERLGRERPRLDVPAIDRDCLAERLLGPDGLTARQTSFAMPDLVQAVAGSLREGADVDRVIEEAEALSRLPARALVRSSAEQLAVEQTSQRDDGHTRLVARRLEELEMHRKRAAEQLSEADRALERLHWWKRGEVRFEHEREREVALRQAILRGLDKRRAQLERTPPLAPRLHTRMHERDELMPTRSLQPEPPGRRTLEREPPSLGLEL